MRQKYSLQELVQAHQEKTGEIIYPDTMFFDFIVYVLVKIIARTRLFDTLTITVPEGFKTFRIISNQEFTKNNEQEFNLLVKLVEEYACAYFGFADSRLEIKIHLVGIKVRPKGFIGNGFVNLKSNRYTDHHPSVIILNKLPTEKDRNKFISEAKVFHQKQKDKITEEIQLLKDSLGLFSQISQRLNLW